MNFFYFFINRLTLILFTLIISNLIGFSQQNYQVDISFNPRPEGNGSGKGFSLENSTSIAKCILPVSNNKMLVGGKFDEYNGYEVNNIVRLTHEGYLDLSFHSDLNFDGVINTLVVQSDGKILVAGEFKKINGITKNRIARLFPNGTLDNSFSSGQGFDSTVNKLLILSSGEIMAVGSFGSYNGYTKRGIVKIQSNGQIDLTFNSGFGIDVDIQNVIEKDNFLFVCGSFQNYASDNVKNFIKLQMNGVRDPNFNNNGDGPNQYSTSVFFNDDGSMILVGQFNSYNGVTRRYAVRLFSDGTLDPTFDLGLDINSSIDKIFSLSSNRIILTGFFALNGVIYGSGLAIINNNGVFENIMNTGNGGVLDVNVMNENEFVTVGSSTQFGNFDKGNITRLKYNNLNNSFYHDLLFNPLVGFDKEVFDFDFDSEQKIYVSGKFNAYNGVSVNSIVRLHPNGTLDSTFVTNNLLQQGAEVKSVKALSDGRVIIGANTVIRLNHDGSIDPNFHIGSFLSGNNQNVEIHDIEIQSDGKYLIGGNFLFYDGQINPRIIRLNQDGTLDPTFENAHFNYEIYNIQALNNGKIYLSCHNCFYFNNKENSFGRFHSNGQIDSSFHLSNFTNIIRNFELIDDKILLTGKFSVEFSPVYWNNLFIDTSGIFNVNNSTSGINSTFVYESIRLNNQILTGGKFNFGANQFKNLVQFKSNGNIDSAMIFNPNGSVNRMSAESSTSFFMGGDFNTIFDQWVSGKFVKIIYCLPVIITDTIFSCTPVTWIDGITYTESNTTATHTVQTVTGCDSVVSLHLTITNPQPISANLYVQPSHPDSCVGNLALHVQGNELFEVYIDDILAESNVSDYSLFSDLCSGVHTLKITDVCGDSLVSSFVIPVDSNYIFTNPFLDSIAVDSLGTTVENCEIDYNSIDTAYIDSLWATGNTVYVIWNIVDANGSNYDTTSFELNNGNGVYYLQLSLFCPNRALGEYFTVSQAIHFSDGSTSIVSVDELEDVGVFIFPNPTSSSVTIQLSGQSAQVKLYDAHGKFIREKTIISSGELSLVDVQSGIYMIEIITDQNRSIYKVIKQ